MPYTITRWLFWNLATCVTVMSNKYTVPYEVINRKLTLLI